MKFKCVGELESDEGTLLSGRGVFGSHVSLRISHVKMKRSARDRRRRRATTQLADDTMRLVCARPRRRVARSYPGPRAKCNKCPSACTERGYWPALHRLRANHLTPNTFTNPTENTERRLLAPLQPLPRQGGRGERHQYTPSLHAKPERLVLLISSSTTGPSSTGYADGNTEQIQQITRLRRDTPPPASVILSEFHQSPRALSG